MNHVGAHMIKGSCDPRGSSHDQGSTETAHIGMTMMIQLKVTYLSYRKALDREVA